MMKQPKKTKRTAIGIVVKDRWEYTHQTLMSLYFASQKKDSYDLFLIDNGSSRVTNDHLRQFVKSALLPVKNLFVIPEQSMSKAWNLFLCMSAEYDYRLKLDNDIVFLNTIPTAPNRFNPLAPAPEGAPSSWGAPNSVSRVMGARGTLMAMRKKVKDQFSELTSSRFLDHMINFSLECNSDLVSLVPVNPDQTFQRLYREIAGRTEKGRPYLFGACMMITKQAFSKIGYFDERLPRRIDIEYSQRAIRNGLNIGYHPAYFCRHLGASSSTEPEPMLKAKIAEAMAISDRSPQIEIYASSIWDAASKKMSVASKKNTILLLE